ncbi:NAD(P)H-hydrate dehydratase [Novosphingobium soli]|uniref:ADP-dependent (S)-NAD(P)H-hydrate dehydratase n=1 Tax=Novosphingobium soli TaxID=574956 RepID=A0ABV6CX13_9SPHN
MAESAPAEALPLDVAWLRAHPLPQPVSGADKNARGRVMVLGGCLTVPGGVGLSAEAALRAGAGKVRVGTVAPAAIALGALLPEAAVLALPVSPEGEIDAPPEGIAEHLSRCDAVVVGPAMSSEPHASRLLGGLLAQADWTAGLVIDAAPLLGLSAHAEALRARGAPAVLTPHVGEIAGMLECDAEVIERDRAAAARSAAERFGAVVVLKGGSTLVAEPGGALYGYTGGNVGLATGGSGDVLAGITGALLARGCSPLEAALWSVWLHGEAGRRCAETIGPLGFLARELLGFIPQVMRSGDQE